MRSAEIVRTTRETDIKLRLEIDGRGDADINTGCGFLDHMLTLFASHGRFDISIICKGDTNVDYHHTVEDVGICLGQAFCSALGDRKGINRYGDRTVPMDESLILTSVDISGRSGYYSKLRIPTEKVGDFDTELTDEFWNSFARDSKMTLHVVQLAGENSHHIIEGVFKSFARSISDAVSVNDRYSDEIPSTKGML